MEWTAVGSRWATWRRRVMRVTGVLLAVGLVLASTVASAERRVALVIGNAAYGEPDARLTNPVNDARQVAKALRELHFDDVFLQEDLDREGMEQAVDDFIGTLRAGDVAVFYYAGTAWNWTTGKTISRRWIFPPHIPPVRARNRALQANEVQALMAEAGAQTRIVILDACRNNPFERVRSLTRGGLGQMTPRGGLVAYATEAGDTAADNGLYAQHLVAALRVPGLPAMELFTRVSEAVEAASGGAQVPIQQFGSAVGRFVFHPGNVVTDPPIVPDPSVDDPVPDPPIVPDPSVDVTQLDVAQLRPMAEQGDARAQTELGERYEDGRGVAQDYQTAVSWFRRAAEQGHAPGQAALGYMYSYGRGVARDDAEAVRWFRLAAEQGNGRGQNSLGASYHNGEGVRQDYAEAIRLYRLAAEQGYPLAHLNLGVLYHNGEGVRQDYAEAVRLYRLAAEQGYAHAQAEAYAQANLGLMYQHGQGVLQDYEEAVRLYRLAAEQGYAPAQANLGFMYVNGRGVASDQAEAVRWFSASPPNRETPPGRPTSGTGTRTVAASRRDQVEAVRLYRLAAEQGNDFARTALDRLGLVR